ncbi:hypothetical protein F4860DRAFT_396729 [Xylaria cubensis]|nr:hypothetical protein F4860DRAFT_396729 [Xylaria cubensis]
MFRFQYLLLRETYYAKFTGFWSRCAVAIMILSFAGIHSRDNHGQSEVLDAASPLPAVLVHSVCMRLFTVAIRAGKIVVSLSDSVGTATNILPFSNCQSRTKFATICGLLSITGSVVGIISRNLGSAIALQLLHGFQIPAIRHCSYNAKA